MRFAFLSSALLLTGCGVPSDPSNGPVVLLCEGQDVSKSDDGNQTSSAEHRYYRLDGQKRTIETWIDIKGSFDEPKGNVVLSKTRALYHHKAASFDGDDTEHTIDFDRVTGQVTETLDLDGGSFTFSGVCKPVKEPGSEKKF